MRISLAVLALLVVPVSGSGQAEPSRWTVREEVRIGSRDAAEQVLTQVSYVRLGPDGAMYVGQPMDRTIRVFGADGREVRRIGREGRGPGEFEGLGAFGFLGDTLYVADYQLGRISLFGADGRFESTFTLRSPLIDDHSPPWYLPSTASWFQSDGTALVYPSMPVMILEAGIITTAPWLRLSRSGAVLDTMAWQDLAQKPVEVVSGGRKYYARVPFASPPLSLVMVDGSGMALIDRKPVERGRATFRVTRIGVDADTLYSREYEYPPVRVPGAAVTDAVERIEETLSRRGPAPAPAEIERALRAGGHIPPHLPPVTAVASGADGSLWLRREDAVGETVWWDVLDRGGALRATLALPRRVTVETVAGDVMVGVELDELDVPYIVRYRILRR